MAKRTGRPTKLTWQLRKKLCGYLAAGHTRGLSARRCGVAEGTFFRWMAEGAEQESGPQREFREAVLRAEDEHLERAERELYKIAGLSDDEFGESLNGSANDGVRLAAVRLALERRHRAEWAQSVRQEVTGADGGAVKVVADVTVRPLVSDEALANMTPEQVEAALSALLPK